MKQEEKNTLNTTMRESVIKMGKGRTCRRSDPLTCRINIARKVLSSPTTKVLLKKGAVSMDV